MKFSFRAQFFLISILSVIILIAACKRGREMITASGMKYILYTNDPGQKATIGDYVTIDIVYKSNRDSILFDSRLNSAPMRFELKKFPFPGSFEDGLTYLAQGDSATFFVSADSMYKYHPANLAPSVSQDQTFYKKGTFLKFDVKMRRVQTYVEAEQEIQVELIRMEKKERVDLDHYLSKKKIVQKPDSNGIYLILHEEGNGIAIDSGKIVSVNYIGKFLNDSIFDSSSLQGKPYRFIQGGKQVIKGWELIFPKLKEGSKATLILPSEVCYSEDGLRNPETGNYIVPPYTPLVYEIEIVKVEDRKAMVKK